MANEAKQRFLDLVVEEVSIVDSPANECNYVVVKNLQEDGDMANTNTQQNAALDSSQAASANTIPVNVESENNTEVIKAMQQVTAMVTSIAKSLEGAKNPDNAENDETKTEKSAATPTATTAVPTATTAAPTAAPEGDGVKTKKNATAQSQEQSPSDAFEDTLKALGAVVEKAKRFTPKREAALKEIVDKLMALSKEMGMEEIPVGQSPTASLPSSASYGGTAISKSLEELTKVVKTLSESMQETTKSLGDRLAKVENIRQPSQGEGDDNSTTKVEKSMWAGIL